MTKESTQALSLSPPPEKELIIKAAEQIAHNLINYQDLGNLNLLILTLAFSNLY
jgi:hypothetical protein